MHLVRCVFGNIYYENGHFEQNDTHDAHASARGRILLSAVRVFPPLAAIKYFDYNKKGKG